MSLRPDRLWLILGLFLAGDAYALGLGEIRLSSALNEPLRAEIALVSATSEDLAELRVTLASADAFERYGLERPLYLTRLQFTVVPEARGAVIRVTSDKPITEPFVTFLVEASWPRGRLLREYTVLLDPPVFAPPPAARSEGVTAPQRALPADGGRIERPAASRPAASAPARPAAAADTGPAPVAGSEIRVARGDTLWNIASRVAGDRAGINQTMLAIYAANPEAFEGNINRLNAGAVLRVPGADDIFRISRADAARRVAEQNAAAGVGGAVARTEPRLELVPPDESLADAQATGAGAAESAGAGSASATTARIRELEQTISEQQSLIEVRDQELARLRAELESLRAAQAAAGAAPAEAATGTAETATPAGEPATEGAGAEQVFAEEGATEAGAEPAEAGAESPEPAAAGQQGPAAPAATPPASARPAPIRRAAEEPGLVDRVLDVVTGFWGILGGVLLVVLAILVWLAKRAAGRTEDESTGVWDALDAGEDVDSESLASTERLRALARDDDSAIVVVEQDRGRTRPIAPAPDAAEATGSQPALEDTFSSETAINLDQSDPIAEADFHMAYGLYDQAADLINGALAVEPERQDLMAKLCEIYFVWGNRDAFVDAAERLDDQLGGETTPDWEKIVIMGRQIAPEHRLFAGSAAAGATRAVDLTLDDGAAELDMDLAGGPDGQVSEIVDLAGSSGTEQSGIDFLFDDELDTGASTTREMAQRGDFDPTLENPTMESTVETPTIEQPSGFGAKRREIASEETAEIDLDDLGLDLQDLAAGGLGDLDDDVTGNLGDLDPTTESGVLAANDDGDATGRNSSLADLDADLDDALAATSEMPSLDEATGRNRALRGDEPEDTDIDLDVTLLDATGQTQVLSDEATLGNDDQTLLASLDDQEYVATTALSDRDLDGDFDFAKTEALDKSTFDRDATGEMPRAGGELDLDLDDLTAALRVSEGDTVDQPRDDATVERPRLGKSNVVDLDFGDLLGDDDAPTEALSPDDLSDDLHDARTMTEVGTKLDLARAYVDMGDPEGARSILEEVLEEGDDGQRQQAQKLIDSLPA
ncbi:MAG TPA: FimV/HubP family polar landmark protein [Gammaproteobacteria bacterium]